MLGFGLGGDVMTNYLRWMSVPLLVAVVGVAAVRAQSPPRVLYLAHSAAFEHGVLPVAEEVMLELEGEADSFDVTVFTAAEEISAERLRDFDAVMFFTTGELPMNEAQQSALTAFIRDGGGFIGVHSASDTFYEWPEYGEMLGGYFDGHPWHQEVTIRVEDQQHAATQHLGDSLRLYDEIYQFRNWSREDVSVLLSLETDSVDMGADGINRSDGDFAVAWTRQHGAGRVFYTALGHEPEVWRDMRFRRHLVAGIRWAAGVED
tara:strand:- start:59 stop:844 length:786 start_codon:yes stop_codon:yes gene_type:complete